RPLLDVFAPDTLRADHSHGRTAKWLARPVCVSFSRGPAMSDSRLNAICDLIQDDVGGRGLRRDPADNLITRTAGDFQAGCRNLANSSQASVAVLTGFYIISADPPAGETDGPLGALFLARALCPLGISVALITDSFCSQALDAGLDACRLYDQVSVL